MAWVRTTPPSQPNPHFGSNCTSLLPLCETRLGKHGHCYLCSSFAQLSGALFRKLSDVAEKLSCRLEGDRSVEITSIAGMDHATSVQISYLANRGYFAV